MAVRSIDECKQESDKIHAFWAQCHSRSQPEKSRLNRLRRRANDDFVNRLHEADSYVKNYRNCGKSVQRDEENERGESLAWLVESGIELCDNTEYQGWQRFGEDLHFPMSFFSKYTADNSQKAQAVDKVHTLKAAKTGKDKKTLRKIKAFVDQELGISKTRKAIEELKKKNQTNIMVKRATGVTDEDDADDLEDNYINKALGGQQGKRTKLVRKKCQSTKRRPRPAIMRMADNPRNFVEPERVFDELCNRESSIKFSMHIARKGKNLMKKVNEGDLYYAKQARVAALSAKAAFEQAKQNQAIKRKCVSEVLGTLLVGAGSKDGQGFTNFRVASDKVRRKTQPHIEQSLQQRRHECTIWGDFCRLYEDMERSQQIDPECQALRDTLNKVISRFGTPTLELLLRILRTAVKDFTDKVRTLVELLLAEHKVHLAKFALWCELVNFGTYPWGGKNVSAIIEETAFEKGFIEVVRNLPPTTYCAELCIVPNATENTSPLAATHISFVTQDSEAWITEGPLQGPMVRRPSPEHPNKGLHTTKSLKVGTKDLDQLALERSQPLTGMGTMSTLGGPMSGVLPPSPDGRANDEPPEALTERSYVRRPRPPPLRREGADATTTAGLVTSRQHRPKFNLASIRPVRGYRPPAVGKMQHYEYEYGLVAPTGAPVPPPRPRKGAIHGKRPYKVAR